MKNLPDRKYLRSDTSIDQQTFDERGRNVGIDAQTHEEVWNDALATGNTIGRNIADARLGRSVQPRRGEILSTRLGSTQDTRAIPYRARRHEKPTIQMPYEQAAKKIPREAERRSLTTARHDRHTRAHWVITQEAKNRGTKLRQLAFGGNLPKTNERLARRATALERLEEMTARRRAKIQAEQADDGVQF